MLPPRYSESQSPEDSSSQQEAKKSKKKKEGEDKKKTKKGKPADQEEEEEEDEETQHDFLALGKGRKDDDEENDDDVLDGMNSLLQLRGDKLKKRPAGGKTTRGRPIKRPAGNDAKKHEDRVWFSLCTGPHCAFLCSPCLNPVNIHEPFAGPGAEWIGWIWGHTAGLYTGSCSC